jgi:hypothetical protein
MLAEANNLDFKNELGENSSIPETGWDTLVDIFINWIKMKVIPIQLCFCYNIFRNTSTKLIRHLIMT